MTCYFDTSLLVKLYVEEVDSPEARRLAGRPDLEVSISWLSHVEMAAAMHSRVFRSAPGSARAQVEAAYEAFVQESSSGMYRLVPIDEAVFDLARSMAKQYGGLLGLRALDVLHVAAAMQGEANTFGTFDQRQGRLAEAVGLSLMR